MTKRKDVTAVRAKKAQLWLQRTMLVTGRSEPEVRALLATPNRKSFRVSSLHRSAATIEHELDALGVVRTAVPWAGAGYTCEEHCLEVLNRSALVSTGDVYIQNAASWLPVIALDAHKGDSVLDVCAAPGGKASYIQALTDNGVRLTCNDNSKSRLLKLQANMARLGASSDYTLSDATRLSRTFEGRLFEKILVDAPCSGEGLMNLAHPKDFDSWSVASVRRLATLQKQILSEAWKLVKPGGTLVYSTCTMAPEEDEAVVEAHLKRHDDASLATIEQLRDATNRLPALSSWNSRPFEHDLSGCLRLIPGDVTETFFVAKLIKASSRTTKHDEFDRTEKSRQKL